MAGVGQMKYSRFLSFNIFGGLGWVLSATLAGYFLGGVPVVRHNFEKVVIGIAVVSVLADGDPLFAVAEETRQRSFLIAACTTTSRCISISSPLATPNFKLTISCLRRL